MEVIEPVDRIQIEGLFTCNYLLYPVENALVDKFSVPREWGLSQGRQFEKLSANTGLPAGLKVMDVAAELAGNLIDPAISASVSGLQWFPEDLKWECKDS